MNPGAALNQESVSIVIPTFNNATLLDECLHSVYELDFAAPLEVIVVDNGSTDSTAEMLDTQHPHVRLVRLEKNTGFAAACNRGASEARHEYIAFLNDDAIAHKDWLTGLFSGLSAGGDRAVCAASHILSRDGEQIEYSGASANLFGVGRPRSVWGWPDAPAPPIEGTALLFASGGAMLIHRATFLDVGGFDPEFFAYFEDVDLGWRLWLMGHRVIYAPKAVVRHIGGATGSRSAAHRRYTLWECNSLATVLKNYESANMERILSTALLLLYKRAVLAAGDTVDLAEYRLDAPSGLSAPRMEELPKVSIAHLAAINRFNERLPHFMAERRRIQARRARSDAEILPLLGRAWEPQFAGVEYAVSARELARAMKLYGITSDALPNRALILASASEEAAARQLASHLKEGALIALVTLTAMASPGAAQQEGCALHYLQPHDPALVGLIEQADVLIYYPEALDQVASPYPRKAVALVSPPEAASSSGTVTLVSDEPARLLLFCRELY